MADTERQAAEADCVSIARAQHYVAMAQRKVTAEERLEFDTRASKALNNYVKACILDVSVRSQGADALSVADIACGRGQDMAKWMYACVAAQKRLTKLVGMDVELGMGAEDLAAKFLGRVCDDVRITAGDMTRTFEGVGTDSTDIVSCQLALHYCFRAEHELQGFFAECARVLKRSGILVVSYIDGRSVVRKCRNVRDDSTDTTTLDKPHYSIRIPNKYLETYLPTPYGNQYIFSMRDCIDAVPEYLVHEGVMRVVAKQHGLHAGTSMAFHTAVTSFQNNAYLSMVGVKMKYIGVEDARAYDTASLYRFSVFSKSSTALRKWDDALKSQRVPCETIAKHHPSSLAAFSTTPATSRSAAL